jgi:dolichol-phosphate mannosyltransferase
LNEISNLPSLLEEIERRFPFPHEVIVVDDGSVDGTRAYLETRASSDPNVRLFLNPRTQTTLRAHHQGLLAARGEFAIVMDSDLQHPPSTIRDLYSTLADGTDIVVASRYLSGGSTGNRQPLRGLISRVAVWLTKLLIPQSRGLSDPLSGYIGLRTAMVRNVRELHRGYKILLFLLSTNEASRIKEIPYIFQERREGISKIVRGADFARTFLQELLADRRLSVRVRRLRSITSTDLREATATPEFPER